MRVHILLVERPELRAAVRARESWATVVSLVMEKKIDSLQCLRTWSDEYRDELRALLNEKLCR